MKTKKLSDSPQQRKRTNLRSRTPLASKCIVCPACTISVRGEEAFESHYQQELEKMKKPFENLDAKIKSYRTKLRSYSINGNEENNEEVLEEKDIPLKYEDRETELKNIKKRKFARYAEMFLITSKKRNKPESTRNYSSNDDSQYELFSCAVCNEFLEASDSVTQSHLAKCFAKRDYEFELYESSGGEDDEVVEEFSWAGQTWIRTASLLDTDALQGEGGGLTRLEMDDGDEELDVDGDNCDNFGNQQFSEVDVIPISGDQNTNTGRTLREAISGGASSNATSSHSRWNDCPTETTSTIEELETKADGDLNILTDLLKKQVKTLETNLENDISKCPICMGCYIDPVVSTSCWHVCCSECWMRTLGAKKLCPKCSNFVIPSQLRKIYL